MLAAKNFFNKKSLSRALIAGFVVAAVLSFVNFDAQCNDIESKVVRLHVLANSNSDYDQSIKLQVKDKVFQLATQLTSGCSSPEEAEDILRDNTDILNSEANDELAALNAPYKAKTEVVTSYFSTREYDTFTLPAGVYTSLRVSIGEANGKNWWCAVYPALCTSACAEFDGFSDEEKEMVTQKQQYEIKFKLYEWYRDIVQFFSD